MNLWVPASAVEAAIYAEHARCAVLLLRAGSSPTGIEQVWGWPIIKLASIHYACDGDLLDRAIDLGSAELVQGLLDLGMKPEIGPPGRFSDGIHERRLARAVWRGFGDVIEVLLEAGCDPNLLSEGASALLIAAVAGHEGVYDQLLQGGARPELLAAAAMGRVEEVRAWLLANPKELEARDERCERTALAWAVHSKQHASVRALLEAGAHVDTIISTVRPLSNTMDLWHPVQSSLMPVKALEVHRATESLLALAIRQDDFESARLLIGHGALGERSSIKALVSSENPDARELLAELLGVGGFQARDPHWAIPALREILSSDLSEAEQGLRFDLLVGAGADKRLVDEGGTSVLRFPRSSRANQVLARRLASLGAPLDLKIAAALGWAEDVLRLEKEAKLTTRERRQMIHDAVMRGHREVILALLETAPPGGLDIASVADSLTWRGWDKLLDEFESMGLVIWDIEDQGRPSLREKLFRSPEAVVRLGLDVHHRDGYGSTPLHAAARAGKDEVVLELLLRGAAVNARDNNGRTALDVCVGYPYWDRSATVRVLLEHGANPLSFPGSCPLEMAQGVKDPKLRRALRDVFAPYVPPEYLAEFDD